MVSLFSKRIVFYVFIALFALLMLSTSVSGSNAFRLGDEGIEFSRTAYANTPANESASYGILQDGLYSIECSDGNSLGFDVAAFSPNNGANLFFWGSNGQANQCFEVKSQGDGSYAIVAYHSAKTIAVNGLSASRGAGIVQWDDNGTSNMRWKIESNADGTYSIVSKDTGLYLDYAADSAHAGAQIVVWQATGSAKQKFKFTPSNRIASSGRMIADGVYSLSPKEVDTANSLVAGVRGGGSGNGANVVLEAQAKQLSQKFYITYNLADGFYSIRSLSSGKTLSVGGIQVAKGAGVVQWDDNGTSNMRWKIESNADGTYSIVSKDTGLYLDYAADSAAVGASFVVWERTGASKQTFSIQQAFSFEDGYYTLSPQASSSMYVDVNGGSKITGTNTILWQKNGGFSQKYYLSNNGDGTCQIKALHSGLVLDISNEGKIIQSQPSSSITQKWFIYPNSTGGFVISANTPDGTVRSFSACGNYYSAVSIWAEAKEDKSLSQSFLVTPSYLIDDGLYSIAPSGSSGLVMGQSRASKDSGTTFMLCQNDNAAWQKYYITNRGDNAVSIKSSYSSKVLATAPDGKNGAEVVQWDDNETANMRWKVTPDFDGSVYLTNQCLVEQGKDMNLDYIASSPEVGARLVIWEAHWGSKQKWTFSAASVTTDTSETYINYTMPLSQMLEYQMTNEYINAPWQEVLYYLNPSSVQTSDGGYYTFADLRGYSGLSVDHLNQFIASTASGRSGKLQGTGIYFTAAAQQYGVNEMYLLAHAILESGWGNSELASGYYYDGSTPIGGVYYPAGTYYNFYGIGAYDSSPLSGGRSMAIREGWSSPELAIKGAASWIAKNYIYAASYPQATIYDMRWNPSYSEINKTRSTHQYATSITWAASIGKLMQQGYTYNYIVPKLHYIIPLYGYKS